MKRIHRPGYRDPRFPIYPSFPQENHSAIARGGDWIFPPYLGTPAERAVVDSVDFWKEMGLRIVRARKL